MITTYDKTNECKLKNLNLLNNIFKKYNINIVLLWGTLLGYIRDKKPIPNDYDDDVGIYQNSDIIFTYSFYNELIQNGFNVTRCYFNKTALQVEKNGNLIDIEIWTKQTNGRYHYGMKSNTGYQVNYPIKLDSIFLEELVDINYFVYNFKIPKYSKLFLSKVYRTWEVPVKSNFYLDSLYDIKYDDKSIIKQLFYEINKSEINYLVLKYEKKQFTNNYEIGGDIDILINDDEQMIYFIEEFLKKHKIIFKINKASDFLYSKNDIGRTYLDIYLNDKEKFDIRLDIFSIYKWNFYGYKINKNFNHLWYLKNMMALKRINNDGIYVPHLHYECSFRKLELFKYPNKKKHQKFLNQHLRPCPRNGMSYIEKFTIKNEGYFLKDLKISLYNEKKMKLFLKNKLPYEKIFDIVPLSESPHIKFLKTKDKNIFNNYHNIVNQDPITPHCNKNYSIERFEKLTKSILELNSCNYNITINNKLITDGCHRSSILYFYFGGDYIINK